jgi:hypothetical protein
MSRDEHGHMRRELADYKRASGRACRVRADDERAPTRHRRSRRGALLHMTGVEKSSRGGESSGQVS